MICILKLDLNNDIAGWIMAYDVPEARRCAQSAGEYELASALYRMEFAPRSGKHELTVNSYPHRYVMLC